MSLTAPVAVGLALNDIVKHISASPIFRGALFLAFVLISFTIANEIYQKKVVEVHITGKTPKDSFTITMPLRDKEHLEIFFRHYCLFEQWAYTLARVKPVTFSACQKTPSWWGSFSLKNKRFLGWLVWKKYERYFQHSDFLVFTDKCLVYDHLMFLTIVDRVQLNKVVLDHAADFSSVLDLDDLTGDALLKEVATQSFLHDILKNHDGLIGTILGYGRNNAWSYFQWRSQERNEPLDILWDEPLMNQMLQTWNAKKHFAPWDSSHLFYPSCAALKDSEESIAIRKTYQKAREKIVAYYEGKDFVEATLSLFAGFEVL